MDIRINKTTNDIEIENNRFSFVDGTLYVEQKLKTNLQTQINKLL